MTGSRHLEYGQIAMSHDDAERVSSVSVVRHLGLTHPPSKISGYAIALYYVQYRPVSIN